MTNKINNNTIWENTISLQVDENTQKKMLVDPKTNELVRRVFWAVWLMQDDVNERTDKKQD